MKTKLYVMLEEGLVGKAFIEIPISELEAIAGDNWLLEVSEQAERLNATVQPHPKDPSVALVARSIA